MKRRGGNAVLEVALFIPILLLLIVGMVQIGKITYLYYTLKKIVYAAGRELAVQQGINFCDVTDDATAQAAINFALNDTTGTPIVANLTALQVTTECTDPNNPGGALMECGSSNCAALTISQRPDFLVVTIPNGGYQVNVRIPFLNPFPVTLNPSVMVPFGGVS
jgi:Flp pilus assembly protein TadG